MSSNFIQKSLKKYSQIYNYYVLIICFLSMIVQKEIYAIVLIAILTIFIFRNNGIPIIKGNTKCGIKDVKNCKKVF